MSKLNIDGCLKLNALYQICTILQELEVMADPTRKEVANVRKKIDMANRELKTLGQSFQKKVPIFLCVKFFLICIVTLE